MVLTCFESERAPAALENPMEMRLIEVSAESRASQVPKIQQSDPVEFGGAFKSSSISIIQSASLTSFS